MTREEVCDLIIEIVEKARRSNGIGYWDHDVAVVDRTLNEVASAARLAIDTDDTPATNDSNRRT